MESLCVKCLISFEHFSCWLANHNHRPFQQKPINCNKKFSYNHHKSSILSWPGEQKKSFYKNICISISIFNNRSLFTIMMRYKAQINSSWFIHRSWWKFVLKAHECWSFISIIPAFRHTWKFKVRRTRHTTVSHIKKPLKICFRLCFSSMIHIEYQQAYKQTNKKTKLNALACGKAVTWSHQTRIKKASK